MSIEDIDVTIGSYTSKQNVCTKENINPSNDIEGMSFLDNICITIDNLKDSTSAVNTRRKLDFNKPLKTIPSVSILKDITNRYINLPNASHKPLLGKHTVMNGKRLVLDINKLRAKVKEKQISKKSLISNQHTKRGMTIAIPDVNSYTGHLYKKERSKCKIEYPIIN